MLRQHILVGVLWVLYGVVHSVLASVGVKNFFRKRMGQSFKHYRLLYTVFAFLSMAAVIGYQLSITSIYLFKQTTLTTWIGAAVAGSGVALMLVCIKKYFMSLSGLRSLVEESPAQELIVSGLHRHLRHPLYLGTFLFLWGLAVVYPSASLMISSLVITLYTLIAIPIEERKLIADFGEAYQRYRSAVPKLIPKVLSTDKPPLPP